MLRAPPRVARARVPGTMHQNKLLRVLVATAGCAARAEPRRPRASVRLGLASKPHPTLTATPPYYSSTATAVLARPPSLMY